MPRTRQVKNLDMSKESVIPEKSKDDSDSFKKLLIEMCKLFSSLIERFY